MRDVEKTFENELEILRTEAESAAQFLFAYLTIHKVAEQHTEVEKLLNTAPLFWNTTLGALQISAFITLGRVFDGDKRSHGVARLTRLAMASPQIFTRDALAARRQGDSPKKPEWLNEFISAAYEASLSDFEFLQQRVSENNEVYEKKFKPIRDKVFAHKDINGNVTVDALFAQTNVSEWQALTLFLQSLYNALWQLFHNGIRPDLREPPHAIAEMIGRPITLGRQVPPHEKVAYEAEKFLLTAAKGKP